MVPPVTGLLAFFFLKEKISRYQVIGVLIAGAGVALFVSNGDIGKLSMGRNLGDLLALTSVLTWSVYTVVTKARLGIYDPLPISTIHMALGFVFFCIAGSHRIPTETAGLTTTDWLIVVAIGVIPSGLAYYWWNAGLRRLSTVNTTTFLFLEAVVVSVTGALLLGELFTGPMVVFAILIVAGVLITQTQRRRARPKYIE